MHQRNLKIVFVLMLALSFIMASCAPAAPVATEPPAATEAPATAAPAATEAPAEVVTITYMRQADNPDIELDYIKEFEEKNPNIKVNVDSVPANDTYNKLVLTTNAGNPPDVFMSFWTASAASNNLIMPLDDYIDMADFQSRFTTAGQSYSSYNGHVYAIAWRAGGSVFLLNCKM